MTQWCIEEAIVLRLRCDEMNSEQEAEQAAALENRLLEIAKRQGRGGR